MTEQALTFRTGDQVTLAAVKTLPDDREPMGLVLLLHGFSSGKNNKTNLALVPRLNSAGMATIRFDFRGHYDSLGDIADTTISQGAADALLVLQETRAMDPALGAVKTSAFGSSFGGAVLLAMLGREHLASIAFRSPVSDYVEMRTLQLGARGIARWEEQGTIQLPGGGGVVELHRTFLDDARRLDLYATAAQCHVPAFIVHGTRDDEVPFRQSERLARTFSACTLLALDGADHKYSNPQHFHEMIHAIADFIIKSTGNAA